MMGRYSQQVEADAASSRQAAGSVGGLSSRMMVPRNTNDVSWRRGGSTQQFVDGVLPLPAQTCVPAPALASAAEIFREQIAEQQSMVTAGARPREEPHSQPYGLDAPADQFPQRADVLEADDIQGSSTKEPYVRSRVPSEHQTPDRIAPDGSVVFVESSGSHKVLQHRIAAQNGYKTPAPRETVGWESAPDAVPQARPKELHRPIDRSCTVLDQVVTADASFMPVYKHGYTGWDNKDLEGARPPGSPGHFATTQGRTRRSRMAPVQQSEPAASPNRVVGASQYQPSWSPSALVDSQPEERQPPSKGGAYGEPMQERGKKTAFKHASRSNTVWSVMHAETAAESGDAVSPRLQLSGVR